MDIASRPAVTHFNEQNKTHLERESAKLNEMHDAEIVSKYTKIASKDAEIAELKEKLES